MNPKYKVPVVFGSGVETPPSDFGWPFSVYPITIRRSGTHYTTNLIPEAYAVAALAGTQYYVDVVAGNNANSGLSEVLAVHDIEKAVILANAAGVACTVNVKAASAQTLYVRSASFSGSSGTTVPTVPIAFRVYGGGRAVVGPFDALFWPGGKDGTYTNCTLVSRSNVSRVFDLLTKNDFGDYTELAKVADAATCDATPGSWAQVGSSLYVNRADSAVTSNTNTRVYLTINNLHAGTVPVYLKGFDLEGGNNGCLNAALAAARDIIAVDCTFKYNGNATYMSNAVLLDNMSGFAAFVRCSGSASAADVFNVHWSGGGTPETFPLFIDCSGFDAGRYASPSNNGITWHDGVIGIVVNGEFHKNRGGNFHIINGSQAWVLGTYCHDSLGDRSLGGSIDPSEFMTGNTATVWLVGTRASGPTGAALRAVNTSKIYKRRHTTLAGTEAADVGALITTF